MVDRDRRSSDPQLLLLQEKLDNHIKEYHEHREEQRKQWDNLIATQHKNTEAITHLTDSTKDLVNVWRAAEGTMTSLSALGRFMKWLSGFAIIGVIASYVSKMFDI
ncbi:TMhelix containing protein [Vibrio phage MZH0603]|nr:TMhelix containing protein [Vibrio phage MZH0603]